MTDLKATAFQDSSEWWRLADRQTMHRGKQTSAVNKQADGQTGKQADRESKQTDRQLSIGLEKKVKARKHKERIKRTKVGFLLF